MKAIITPNEPSQPSHIKFEYSRECIYSVNNRCVDRLSRNYKRNCDGTENCRLPWRDGGWITHTLMEDKS